MVGYFYLLTIFTW